MVYRDLAVTAQVSIIDEFRVKVSGRLIDTASDGSVTGSIGHWHKLDKRFGNLRLNMVNSYFRFGIQQLTAHTENYRCDIIN